jgi:apolipoprotein N-acyltransferase
MEGLIKKYSSGFLCLLSGLIVPFGFSPYNYYIIPFISLTVLFHYVVKASSKQAFFLGYLFAFGMFGSGVNWLHISINLFGGINFLGALFCTYLLVAFISLYPALSCYLAKRFCNVNRAVLLLLGLPSAWVLMEWCRSWIFTGFPWLNLGYSQIDSPLGGIAPIFGVYGVTFTIVLLSSLVLLTFSIRIKFKFLSLGSVFFIWFICGQLYFIDWTERTQTDVSIAMIQGGISQKDKWKAEMRQPSLDLYQNLSENYWGHSLIIWPETAIPAFYHDVKELKTALSEKSRLHNTDILVGVPVFDRKDSHYYNTALLVNKDSEIYYKRHLVPFGEYLPFDDFLRPIVQLLNIPMSNFSKGEQARPLLIGNSINIGISICYEDTFGEEVIEALPEAEVLVNLSNDAWFGDSLAPHQHLQMARMRAMETGRYLLRATNTGISAVIDEKGWIVKRSRQFESDTLSAQISLFSGSTPYSRFGNYPIVIFSLILFLAMVMQHRSKSRGQCQ